MSEEMVITTNNHSREVIHGHNLSEEDRKHFDYYAWPNAEEWEEADLPDRWGEDGPLIPKHGGPGNWGKQVGWDRSFIRYKGTLYDLDDMMSTHNMPRFAGWDQYVSDSFFSGTLFRWARDEFNPEQIDSDYVICAWYYVKG